MSEDINYRKKTLVVAWMDVVLTFIGIVMVLAYAYFLASETSVRITELNGIQPNTTSEKHAVSTDEIQDAIWHMWWRAGFISFVGAIQLCFAFVLTRASESGRNPYAALMMTRMWVWCNLVFLLIWFICAFVATSYILAYIWLAVRVVILYVGWTFMLELQAAIIQARYARSQSETPTQNNI